MGKMQKMLCVAAVMLFTAPVLGACATPMPEYAWGEWIVHTPATCIVDGEEWRYREDSPFSNPIIQRRAIPAMGHDYKKFTTPPTTSTAGSIKYTCQRVRNGLPCREGSPYTYIEDVPQLESGQFYISADNNMTGGRVITSHTVATTTDTITITVIPDTGFKFTEGTLKANQVVIADGAYESGTYTAQHNVSTATNVVIYAEFEHIISTEQCDNVEIIGTWKNTTAGITFVFNQDGTANLSWTAGNAPSFNNKAWTYVDGILWVADVASLNNVPVTINGNIMTLGGAHADVQLTRQS